MSTLAGALGETKPSIYTIPKREDKVAPFKQEEDVEMDEYHPEPKQDQEMEDDLFGNDEVEVIKYLIFLEAFSLALIPPSELPVHRLLRTGYLP